MTIETKYDKDPFVWVMDKNKPSQRRVTYIKWNLNDGVVYIVWTGDDKTAEDEFYENECYPSKEALLQSL